MRLCYDLRGVLGTDVRLEHDHAIVLAYERRRPEIAQADDAVADDDRRPELVERHRRGECARLMRAELGPRRLRHFERIVGRRCVLDEMVDRPVARGDSIDRHDRLARVPQSRWLHLPIGIYRHEVNVAERQPAHIPGIGTLEHDGARKAGVTIQKHTHPAISPGEGEPVEGLSKESIRCVAPEIGRRQCEHHRTNRIGVEAIARVHVLCWLSCGLRSSRRKHGSHAVREDQRCLRRDGIELARAGCGAPDAPANYVTQLIVARVHRLPRTVGALGISREIVVLRTVDSHRMNRAQTRHAAHGRYRRIDERPSARLPRLAGDAPGRWESRERCDDRRREDDE